MIVGVRDSPILSSAIELGIIHTSFVCGCVDYGMGLLINLPAMSSLSRYALARCRSTSMALFMTLEQSLSNGVWQPTSADSIIFGWTPLLPQVDTAIMILAFAI